MKINIIESNKLVLAVDIGTSGCRAVLIGSNNMIVASVEQQYTYCESTAGGFAEQDPDLILSAFLDVMNRVSVGFSDRIEYVVLDSVLHSLVLLGDSGTPLTPLSIWADTRATSQCKSLKEYFVRQKWHQKTGCPLYPSYPLARLLWYKEQQPTVYRVFSKAISIKSYILFRLFGIFIEDYCLASGSGIFNLHNFKWDDEIINHLGIGSHRLPDPVPVEYHLQYPYNHFGRAAGLPKNATWVIGGGDGPMAHIGTAGYRTDVVSMTIGTSSAVRLLSPRGLSVKNPGVWTYVLDKKNFISGIASNYGGNILDWSLCNIVKWDSGWFDMDAKLMASNLDKGLFFFPCLKEDRNSICNFGNYSGFLGRKDGHSAINLLRSIIEGIVFHNALLFKQLVSNHSVTAIALSGSLTKLQFVREIIAELHNMPIMFVPESHAPHFGSLCLLTGQQIAHGKLNTSSSRHGYEDKFMAWCSNVKK